ncbi:hypothetical protein pb186bvf_000858 [Paramecium bursaria]
MLNYDLVNTLWSFSQTIQDNDKLFIIYDIYIYLKYIIYSPNRIEKNICGKDILQLFYVNNIQYINKIIFSRIQRTKQKQDQIFFEIGFKTNKINNIYNAQKRPSFKNVKQFIKIIRYISSKYPKYKEFLAFQKQFIKQGQDVKNLQETEPVLTKKMIINKIDV